MRVHHGRLGVRATGGSARRVNAAQAQKRPGLRLAAAGLVVALVVVVAGLTWSQFRERDGVSLTTPSDAAFGISLPSTNQNEPYTFGSIPVCLRGQGRAVIDRVETLGAQGGMKVDAFAVRPLSSNMFGAEQVALASTGFGSATEVTQDCATAPGGSELAVQLSKTANGNARTRSLLVSWHSDSESGEVTIPGHIVLCQGPDQDIPDCQAR